MASDDSSAPFSDKEIGDRVSVTIEGEKTKGTLKRVTRGSPVDDFPEVGETVTFKSVRGEVERTVDGVDPSDEYPISVEEAGRYRRTNFAEYTVEQDYRILKTDDGREIWFDTDPIDEVGDEEIRCDVTSYDLLDEVL